MIWFGFLGIIGTTMTLFLNVWVISSGRLLHGISAGIFMSVAPRMLDETVPAHLLGSFGVYTNIYANIAILFVLMLGLGLPQGENPSEEELLADEFWRVCYGLPIIILSVGITLLYTVFPEDSINYHVGRGEKR